VIRGLDPAGGRPVRHDDEETSAVSERHVTHVSSIGIRCERGDVIHSGFKGRCTQFSAESQERVAP